MPRGVGPRTMTPEMREWVRANYAGGWNDALAAGFEAEFGVPTTAKSLMAVARELGVSKAGRGHIESMGGHLGFVLEYGRSHTSAETAAELERRYGVRRRPCAISSALRSRGVRRAMYVDGRQVPANSGELLDVRVVNGEPKVKVGWFCRRRQGDNWVALMRFEWERVHGPLPPGWRVLSVNGDRSDARPENMVACSHAAHSSLLNRFGPPPYASRGELEAMVALCEVVARANAAEDAIDPKARKRRYLENYNERKRSCRER